MDKLVRIVWVTVVIGIITLLYFATAADNKKKKEMLKQRAVADVIMIQKSKWGYIMVLDGYEIQEWSKEEVCVKVDPHTTTITAKFTPDGNGHYYETSVILTFASKEEARKAFGDGYVSSVGDGNVIIQNKNDNNSCFISAVFQ